MKHFFFHRFNLLHASALLGLALVFPGTNLGAPAPATQPQPARLSLLRSDAQGAVLDLSVPDYQVSAERLGQQRLQVSGAESTATLAQPEMPVFPALLGVPPGAQVALHIRDIDTVAVERALTLPSVPQPLPISEDFQPGILAANPDDRLSGGDACYPSAPARITDDAWLRDQRIVRVELYPLQYCPEQQRLLWHRQLQVELTWASSVEASADWQAASADPFAEPILQQALLNYAAARSWRVAPQRSSAGAAQPAAEAARYKIGVDRDGLYRLSYADLQAAGMPVDTVDPRTFRLSSQGRDVAINVAGEADGSFDPDDTVLFYGEQLRTRAVSDTIILDGTLVTADTVVSRTYADATEYTGENVYWLDVGDAPGPRMAQVDATPQGASTPAFFRDTVRAEQSTEWWTWHFTSRDPWFWSRLTTSASITGTYTTTLTAPVDTMQLATVRGELVARAANDAAGPDHRTRATINGTLVEDTTWDGRIRHRFTGQVPQAALQDGDNDLALAVIAQPALGADDIFFDWFEVEYDRRFVAIDDQLRFTYAEGGTWQYAIGGFSAAAIQVYDITTLYAPRMLLHPAVAVDGATYQASFQVTQPASATYIAATATAFKAPRSIVRMTPTDLRAATNGADYIFITHRDFYTATLALADYRVAQGLRTTVVDIDDLYNEFNDGIYHPVAIKRFLAYAYATWQPPAPQYALLVGDGHWNFKRYNPDRYGAPPIFIPPNLAWVDPWQGEVDSTGQLAAVVGDDILPDLAIGRLPVNTVAELQAVIDKIIAYEQGDNLGDWQNRLVFVADNTPDSAGDFVASAESVISATLPADVQASRIYLDDLCGPPANPPQPCPAATQAITATLNTSGAFVLTYIGHGSIQSWAKEQALTVDTVAALSNGNWLPLVLSMTCLDGYWIHPALPSLAETLVRSPTQGAIAAFAPTGLGLATGHDVMLEGFYTSVLADGARQLGPASAAAKLALFATGSNLDLIHTFTVIGDPALRLPLPSDPPQAQLPVYLPLITRPSN
jgi:hypothetical protein